MLEANLDRSEERAHVNGDGGEEMVNIVMELVGVPMPGPQDPLVLTGLDTPTPTLQLKDGTMLTGAFEETVGTQMVFKESSISKNMYFGDAGPSKTSAEVVEGSGAPSNLVNIEDSVRNSGEPKIELEAFTDVKLVFRKNN